ncbi:hypothetical protein TNCV_635991 [Trichonephila clavipes]|nr:hypothetical protein TNCV_635991 [Trichonephila clavipes]
MLWQRSKFMALARSRAHRSFPPKLKKLKKRSPHYGRRPGPRPSWPMPDEAHFWLNGYVNKQNCRIWSEANPQVYVETPLHPEKLTVWCAL